MSISPPRSGVAYFLDQDADGHWYLIEEGYREEWFSWTDLDSDQPDAWVVPVFARALGTGPEAVFFFDPVLPC
jgi:hypothetical protein